MRASTRRPGRSLLARIVLSSLAVAAGCGDSTGPGTSSFSAEVTGATNKSYTGDALALSDPTFGFALILESEVSEGPNHIEILLAREAAGAPAVGTYDIVDFLGGTEPLPEEFAGSLILSANTASERDCRAVAGTITFTSASDDRAAGSFAFAMVCTLTDDPEAPSEDASVEGTFEAIAAIEL